MTARGPLPRRAAAATLALALHGLVAAALLWQSPPRVAPAPAAGGAGGIMIALGEGVAPSVTTAELVESDTAQAEVPAPVPATAEPEPVTAVEPAAEPTPAAEQEPVETPPPDPTVTAVEPEPLPVLTPDASEPAPEPPSVAAVEQPTVPTAAPQRRPPDAVPPPPRPTAQPSRPTPTPPARSPAPTTSATAPPAASGPASNETATMPAGGRSASGEPAGGTGSRAAQADYFSMLGAWFERQKRYPRQARLRRQEGSTLLAITIARDGRVLDYGIHQGSGYPLLDRAVLDMIGSARQLPAFPDTMPEARLQIVVPIRFELRAGR